jgi:DNA primase
MTFPTQLQNLIDKLNARALGDGWYEALCPFHKDTHASLVFNRDGFQCMACFKKGTLEELAEKLMA